MSSLKKITIMEEEKFQKQFSKIFQNKSILIDWKGILSQEKIIKTTNTVIHPNKVMSFQSQREIPWGKKKNHLLKGKKQISIRSLISIQCQNKMQGKKYDPKILYSAKLLLKFKGSRKKIKPIKKQEFKEYSFHKTFLKKLPNILDNHKTNGEIVAKGLPVSADFILL